MHPSILRPADRLEPDAQSRGHRRRGFAPRASRSRCDGCETVTWTRCVAAPPRFTGRRAHRIDTCLSVVSTVGREGNDRRANDRPREPGPARSAYVDPPTRMLVFGVARHDGSIPAAEVFAVAEACHRSTEQARTRLRRLLAEGLFVRRGVGQRATYHPTDDGLRALAGFGGRPAGPCLGQRLRRLRRHWHLVAFAVPEARRTAWMRCATSSALGGAPSTTACTSAPTRGQGRGGHRRAARRRRPRDPGPDRPAGRGRRERAPRAGRPPVAHRRRGRPLPRFLDRWSVALDHMSQMQRQRAAAARLGLPARRAGHGARLPCLPRRRPAAAGRPAPTLARARPAASAREQPAPGPAPAGRERPARPVRHLRRPAPDTARRRRLGWRGDAGPGRRGRRRRARARPHEPDDDHDSDDAAARHSPGGQQ